MLLSSHLLYEVEKIADELILIGHGRIVAQGTKQELLHTRGAYVRAVEHEALRDALRRRGHPRRARPATGLRSDAEAIQIGKVAAANGITLVELRPAEGSGLEDLFLQLTADTQRDGTRRPRRSTGMTATTVDPGASTLDVSRHAPDPAVAGWCASSCASWSTPARASGC